MTMLARRIISHVQKWRNGPISCFVWPADELTVDPLTTDVIGDAVNFKGKLPNWRYRIAHGQNATTTLDAEYSTLTYVPGLIYNGKWCQASQRFGYYQYSGDLFIGLTNIWNRPPIAPTLYDSKTRDEALIRAIRDARSKQNRFRGGNFLAELADTIRGLRNPAKGFRDLLDTYHRNARKRVKRAVGRRNLPTSQQDFRRLERDAPDVSRAAQRALGDTWLEHNFGWAPLLSDAVDAYHALRRLSLQVPLARFYGTSSNETAPTYAGGTRDHNGSDIVVNSRSFFRYDVTFYGAVKVTVDSPTGRAVEEFGVRARDFLPAVWEAIPYSFLIDYFSDIGDIIECVSFPRSDIAWMAMTFRNHSIRSTERVAVSESLSFPANNGTQRYAFTPPRVEWDRKYVKRVAYTGSTVPSLRFEIPGSKNWRKWLNVAALARLRTL